MNVLLHPPRTESDTVKFTWEHDTGLPDPPDGGLFYRYEGIDLGKFSDALWMEIFLAVRLGTYARLQQPIALRLPTAVPQAVIDFWRVYHGADQVEIAPVAASSSYSPRRPGHEVVPTQYDAAVFFGGGRDSLATACLLGEVYGRERVLLIQCVDPHGPGEERRQRTAKRQERFSLVPAKDTLGFATQRVWSNLHAVALTEGGKQNEPHLEQYTAGLLPVLLSFGVPLSTPGYSWIEFVVRQEDGRLVFRYPRSRPEMLAALGRHYARVMGFVHQPVNVNLALTGPTAFQLLARRYPDAFPHILTCQDGGPDTRWCQQCRRCSRYAWLCLENGVSSVDFDLDVLMGSSRWVERFMAAVAGLDAPRPGGNAPFTPGWCSPYAFAESCNSFHRTDVNRLQSALQAASWGNALVMQALYGNRAFPAYDAAPPQAFELLPRPLGEQLQAIVAEILPVAPIAGPLLAGDDDTVLSPFAVPFHNRLLDLPHLQEATG